MTTPKPVGNFPRPPSSGIPPPPRKGPPPPRPPRRPRLVVDGGGHRLDPYRPAVVLLDNGLEEALVQAVEAAGVHPLTGQGVVGDLPRDHAVPLDLGVVPHAPEQAVGDPGGAAGAPPPG